MPDWTGSITRHRPFNTFLSGLRLDRFRENGKARRKRIVGSIKNGAKNPGQPPPCPGRISRLRVPPKVKAQV
jgi:hypothetical protein